MVSDNKNPSLWPLSSNLSLVTSLYNLSHHQLYTTKLYKNMLRTVAVSGEAADYTPFLHSLIPKICSGWWWATTKTSLSDLSLVTFLITTLITALITTLITNFIQPSCIKICWELWQSAASPLTTHHFYIVSYQKFVVVGDEWQQKPLSLWPLL